MKKIINKIDWKKGDGLIPAVIQDVRSGVVLMLGFMNEEALTKTLKTKKVWFYSRSKKRLWMKGEESENILNLVEIKFDCDKDALLVSVIPKGPTCHNGKTSCFGDEDINDLGELFSVIEERKREMPENSYTASLFSEGTKKICRKVKEESTEVIQAANTETKQRLVEESIDLIYHLFVLLVNKKITYRELLKEMERRRNRTR